VQLHMQTLYWTKRWFS